MLLFATQYLHGKGDFLSLNIVDEYLEFRFDLGDGPVTIRYAYQTVTYTISPLYNDYVCSKLSLTLK